MRTVESQEEQGTAQRLVDAGIALIAVGGLRGLTIRDVAARAGIAFPSVQYHFPTKARLVEEIFLAVECRHCQASERLLAGLGFGETGEPPVADVVLAILWDWCANRTAETIAVHEMLLAAHRGGAYGEYGRRWVERHHALYLDLTRRLTGQPDSDLAWFILEMLIGLSLMTLGCENPIEAGLANAEIVRYAFAEPTLRSAFEPSWYRMFLERADREPDSADNGKNADAGHPSVRKILDASIRIVASEGSGALTFRGVASEAGVAIASITNNFHTREALIYRVYRCIQDEMAELAMRIPPPAQSSAEGPSAEGPSGDEPSVDNSLRLLQSVSTGDFPLFVAAYDLILAAARDPALGKQAWRIRITRGIYLLIRRGHMPAPPIRAQFAIHTQSLCTIGIGLLHGIGAQAGDRDGQLARRLRFALGRLRG